MKVFMDRNGMFYVSEVANSIGDAEKPFVSEKLKKVLEFAGVPLNEEQIAIGLAALESESVAA